MDNLLKEKVFVEMENIAKVLAEIEKIKDKPQKQVVELAGIGAFLQNIYTGMENILKQFLLYKNVSIDRGPQWHREVLKKAVDNDIISKDTSENIGKYLFFRHFFVHSYSFLLNKDKIEPLMHGVGGVYSDFKAEIEKNLS